MVLELACALGVASEFPNAHKLFSQWTRIEITEKTLANQVEKTGNVLQTGCGQKSLVESNGDRQTNKPSKLIIIIIEVRPPQMPIKEKLYTNVAVS